MTHQNQPAYTNRLVNEKSPYLLQHAHNPVDWFPWGEEAFEKAKKDDKMILVSIGYATCHWCHVMERESFEDERLAEYLNEHFVAIKVDREERPDVDKIYMDALHALNQQGGWPLNMFITPEGKPVTGGTYFPPDNRYGRSSFRGVLEMIADAWKKDRENIYNTANSITEHLKKQSTLISKEEWRFDWKAEEDAINYYKQTYDYEEGGFSLQPQNKFPPSMGLMLLLRNYKRTGDPLTLTMVEITLRKMFNGGIYDQIGGGLSRYSTDYQWLVPHFEKMLYDNALFVWVLIETFQVTNERFYQEAAEDVLSYIQRDMISSEGAFYSAEDADSEGEEGKFYVWTQEEILEILGSDLGSRVGSYWNVNESGNFENGQSILHCPKSVVEVAADLKISEDSLIEKIEEARQKLFMVRSKRIRPLCDDKILTSWNGLMISAFAKAARIFDKDHYGLMAEQAADFILSNLVDKNGRLLRRYREGEARYKGYLCDYAQMAMACLDLYEYSYDLKWFKNAVRLSQEINALFRNEVGPYFDVGSDSENLLTRNMEGYDGVEPSGNSTTTLTFLKLEAYGLQDSRRDAERILKGFESQLKQAGVSFSAMHWALHWTLSNPKQVVIIGERGESSTEALLKIVRSGYYPNIVTAFSSEIDLSDVEEIIPLVKGRVAIDGKATAYVCENMVCQLPVHHPNELQELLKK